MNARPEFRTFLREIRERTGVSQRKLAQGAGISPTYMQQIEKGHVNARRPSKPIVQAIVSSLATLPNGPTPSEQRELFRLAGYPQPEQTPGVSGQAAEEYPLADFTISEVQALTLEDLRRIVEEASRRTGFGVRLRQDGGRSPTKPGREAKGGGDADQS